MTTKTITALVSNGQPWGEPPNGPYYPFKLTLDDGMVGVANAKSTPPPYKVGDQVGIEVTGQDKRGNNKLKVDRKWPSQNPNGGGSAFASTNTPTAQQNPANPAPVAQNGPSTAASNPHDSIMINGQTVGMAINNAVDALKSSLGKELKIEDGSFVRMVNELASQIIRISYKLEHGKLAEPLAIKQAQAMAAAAGFTPAVDDDSGPPF